MFEGMSRRQFMRVAAAGAGGLGALATMAGPVIERAHAADPCGTGSLDDIDHFVLLMMENRSFDHYYGTMSGVRGFADARAAGTLRQYYDPADTSKGWVAPFRLDTTRGATLDPNDMRDGECINDPTHNWGPQHQAWNSGRMDQWLKVHVANEGTGNGPATMGFYEKADIPVHRALADAFTVCDHYFCSVLGPTDPNRLYWISAWLDPEGKNGGPLLDTPTTVPTYKYSWRTFPENLEDAGVSWKFYTAEEPPGISAAILSGMTQSFKQYDPAKNPNLFAKGLAPIYPTNFQADVLADRLPSVSWIIPPLLNCEHPALPPSFGAMTLIEVLDTLTSNPKVWEKTALIISYDENGGFFDHVPPPTPPRGTPGEMITATNLDSDTASAEANITGPIGLGFRVPGLVISPYSRGGLVASEVFDHTSQLKLIAKRFGVDVPNISKWRDETVGDMTSAFDFASAANTGKPKLEATHELDAGATLVECKAGTDSVLGSFAGQYNRTDVYPVQANNAGPTQASEPKRRAPSGPVTQCKPTKAATTDATSTKIPVTKPKTVTRTRVGAAADSLQAQQLADTGPDTTRTALAGAALLAAGAVTVAAAPQVAQAVTRATRGDEQD